MLHPETGYAINRREYDARGNVITESYFGVDGQPIIATEANCASVRWEYDDIGNKVYWGYFDTKNEPITSSYSYASTTLEYDYDILKEQLYFDEAGNILTN